VKISFQLPFRIMVHNQLMRIHSYMLALLLLIALLAGTPALAQDDGQPGDTDGSSEQVESSDEAYRRRMELEDARRADPSYTDPIDSYKKDPEKIDKLPEESRDNIRDQLIDVIVENGEWEPSDALEDYPYEPTEAAKNDPVLKEQEQEAWEEQVDKYHEREAAAFGSYRGPVPGPGNPTGQQGGSQGSAGSQQGQGQAGGQQGQGGADGSQGSSGSAGTYQPGANGSDDAASTDGVSESALDFLKGRQTQNQSAQGGPPGPTPPGSSTPSGSQGQASPGSSSQNGSQAPGQQTEPGAEQEQEQTAGAQQSAAQWAQNQQQAASEAESEQASEQQAAEQDPAEPAQPEQQAAEQQSEQAQQAEPEVELETRGIIAIEDLDKLEGADLPEEPGDQEEP
jgi:hypothetical protein